MGSILWIQFKKSCLSLIRSIYTGTIHTLLTFHMQAVTVAFACELDRKDGNVYS